MMKWRKMAAALALTGVIQFGAGLPGALAAPPERSEQRPGTQADMKRPPAQRSDEVDRHRDEKLKDERQRTEWQRRGTEQMDRVKNEPPRRDWNWKERDDWERQARAEWQRNEYNRHAWEMKRRDWEAEREWRERQRLEEIRHERRMQELEAELLVSLLRIFATH